ncbi:phosphonate transport system ATP-binding protein [Sinobaca qinghaiensis]|uniref:Phosphonate transport system ATP-binding protein n=1 Tax=Sinobaca qinghaiensis TaxID=342944 RepID=A0A419V5H6_9BACL|nr:phosphonate ABC transporter ATP-binding protein [Sinobaca qinghaiensis]RKD75242.1 phosphonate transport system ATP-binding protein [Sinobaca qinghaiensis]
MIELKDVSVQYDKSGEPALKKLNLSLERGEFVSVLGPSGAGKSTMIRTINALQPATGGDVLIDGKSLAGFSRREQRQWRSRAGMIFQHFHLIPRLTVKQNVLSGLFGKKDPWSNLGGFFSAAEKKQAAVVIEQVGLQGMEDRKIEQLSGGQKQRVGVARALIQDPDVFLGDEPVASLDPGTSRSIFSLIEEVHKRNNLVTMINVHDIDLAKMYSDRIIGLSEGEVVYDGPPSRLNDTVIERIYGKNMMADKKTQTVR